MHLFWSYIDHFRQISGKNSKYFMVSASQVFKLAASLSHICFNLLKSLQTRWQTENMWAKIQINQGIRIRLNIKRPDSFIMSRVRIKSNIIPSVTTSNDINLSFGKSWLTVISNFYFSCATTENTQQIKLSWLNRLFQFDCSLTCKRSLRSSSMSENNTLRRQEQNIHWQCKDIKWNISP